MRTASNKQKGQSPSKKTTLQKAEYDPPKVPFIEHLHELRRRLYYSAFSVIVWGVAIYVVQQHVVNILLRPADGQHFIYTTPGGGIDFLFRVCVYGGLILSLPVMVYNTLRFIEPLISDASRRFILIGSAISGLLAVLGIIFGYIVGLPAALHFLLHQFTTVQIQPLVTIQSYLSFVIVYMVGSAMLFQLPLLLVLINRIKPLKPKRLLHYERWVILIAFIIAGLMNPTPNILSQLLVAGPFIVMYQVGILLIAFLNRSKRQDWNEESEAQELSIPLIPGLDTQIPNHQMQSFTTPTPPANPAKVQKSSSYIADVVHPKRNGSTTSIQLQQPRARLKAIPINIDTPRRRFMDFTPSNRPKFTTES